MITLFILYIYGCVASMMSVLMLINYFETPKSQMLIGPEAAYIILFWPIALMFLVFFFIYSLATIEK